MPATLPKSTITVPQGTPAAKCRGCDATIYWITTKYGRKSPVDCDPARVEGARVPSALIDPLQLSLVLGTAGGANTPRDGLGASHFANCPAADRFR